MNAEPPDRAAPALPIRSAAAPSLPTRVALLVLTWIALTGTLIAAGTFVVHSGPVNGFDHRVTASVVAHRTAGLNAAMKAVTWLGSWVALSLTALTVAVLVLRRRLGIPFLLLAVAAWAGTQGATTLAKQAVQRPRPPEEVRLVGTHGWAWPSGHAATATLVFAVVAAMVWILIPSIWPRLVTAVVCAAAVATVAFSRVELGVHWTTDVLAGIAFVVAWLCVSWMLFGAVASHRPQG